MLVGFSLFLLLFLSACTTDSDDLNTSDIEAEMQIIMGVNKALARADFSVAGGVGVVELSSKDKLYVNTDLNVEKPLTRTGTEGRYEAEFIQAEYNAEFTFNLQRDNDKYKDAPNSTVTIPAILNITTPDENDEFIKDDATNISLTWDNSSTSSGNIDIDITSNCEGEAPSQTPETNLTTEDDGAYLIENLGRFYPVIGDVSCELAIKLRRSKTGSSDNHLYSGSNITSEQTDNVTIKLMAN